MMSSAVGSGFVMESYWVVRGSGETSGPICGGTHLCRLKGRGKTCCVGAHLVEEELVVLVREVVVRLDDLV